AYVRPSALLNASHHNQIPLQTLGSMGGQHPNPGPAQLGFTQRVCRDLLGLDLSQETSHATETCQLVGASGDLEQGAEGIQVAIGPTTSFRRYARLLSKP